MPTSAPPAPKNAFGFDAFLPTNLYDPISYPRPDFGPSAFLGNDLSDPALTGRTRLTSVAVGDTLSMVDDKLLVTLGLRYQDYRVENFAFTTGIPADPYDKSRTSPAAGIVYKATQQISVYGNYVEGLVQGPTGGRQSAAGQQRRDARAHASPSRRRSASSTTARPH